MTSDEAKTEAEKITAGSLLKHLHGPAELCPPRQYEIDHDGVWLLGENAKGDMTRTRIAFAPLIVIRTFTDPAENQLVELAWRDGDRAVSRTVPRVIAKSGRALVKELGNAGIPIVEADARPVERYLAALEAENRHVIPHARVARQLGWQLDGEFVTGQDNPLHVEPLFDEQRVALAAHRSSGTLEEWKAAIKRVEAFPLVRIMLAASFAAPLLEVLDLDSVTVDLSGRSTGGKTTTARVAFSAWGCPTEQSGGISSWRTTLYAAEKRLNLCNGLPVVFDETRAAKVETLIDQVLYQVPMNRGTSRGHAGYASDLLWRVVLLSTGEQPALSFTTNEGASARILSLRGAPFGRLGEESARAAREITAGVADNFGTAGPAFAARLRQEIATDDGRAALRRRHLDLVRQHNEGSDVNRRRARHIAAVRLAAELAYEWNISPLPSLKAEEWKQFLSVEQQKDDRGEMALEIAREFVAGQGHRMWSQTAQVFTNGGRSQAWIGAYLHEGDRRTVALLPEALAAELAKAGYRIDAAREAWRDNKLITLDSKGDLIRRRFDSGRVRVYEFDRAIFDDDNPPAEPTPETAGQACQRCSWPLDSVGHADRCGTSHE